jgi:hypothetical protein
LFYETYDFLGQSDSNAVVANQQILSFIDGTAKIVKSYPLAPKTTSFDSININRSGVSVVPHYDPSEDRSSSYSSSNNNNNNNNNNNR